MAIHKLEKNGSTAVYIIKLLDVINRHFSLLSSALNNCFNIKQQKNERSYALSYRFNAL